MHTVHNWRPLDIPDRYSQNTTFHTFSTSLNKPPLFSPPLPFPLLNEYEYTRRIRVKKEKKFAIYRRAIDHCGYSQSLARRNVETWKLPGLLILAEHNVPIHKRFQ